MRCAAALIAVGIACSAAVPVAAAPPLSSVVISHPLPGFVADPPGPNNGYLAPSDANQPGLGLSSDLVEQYGADGDLTSYVRTWHDPQTGDGLEMIATRFANPSLIPLFVNGVAGMQHNTAFRMDGRFAAEGYSITGTMGGIGFAQYVVMFTVGQYGLRGDACDPGHLNAFDAFRVAQEQAQAVAGPSGTGAPWWHVSHDVMWLLAFVVIALLVLWRVTRRPRGVPSSSTRSLILSRSPSPPRSVATKASRRSRSEAPPPVALPRRRPRDPGLGVSRVGSERAVLLGRQALDGAPRVERGRPGLGHDPAGAAGALDGLTPPGPAALRTRPAPACPARRLEWTERRGPTRRAWPAARARRWHRRGTGCAVRERRRPPTARHR